MHPSPIKLRPKTSLGLAKSDLSIHCNEGEQTLKEPNKRKDRVTIERWRRVEFKRSGVFASKQSRTVLKEIGIKSGLHVDPESRLLGNDKVKTDVGWCVQKPLIWSPMLGLEMKLLFCTKWLRSSGQRWGVLFLPSILPPPKFLLIKFQAAKFQGVCDLKEQFLSESRKDVSCHDILQLQNVLPQENILSWFLAAGLLPVCHFRRTNGRRSVLSQSQLISLSQLQGVTWINTLKELEQCLADN